MGIRQEVLALQWAQRQHDDAYHADILLLSVADRLKHMALHIAKYVGNLVDAIDARKPELIDRVLVDTLIIDLATANTLNFDLGSVLDDHADESFRALGGRFAQELNLVDADDERLLRQLAKAGGLFAKACESTDHLENFAFSEAAKSATSTIFKLVVTEAALRDLDVKAQMRTRLRQVEQRNIFYSFHERGTR